MKSLFLILFLVSGYLQVSFSQRMISGEILDKSGQSLVGASILLKNTDQGTTSDQAGRFSLTIPSSEAIPILLVSYTGFLDQEITVGLSDYYSIILEEVNVQLAEVTVIGYGSQQKRTITGNIASVKGEEIAFQPVQSFDQALQGRAAGVNISLPNGVLNNPPVIRIRGINSINLSSFPLIVIDGTPTYSGNYTYNSAANNPLSNLNPADIESIEILKDASAAAIYGSRAGAGVVLITTKRGKQGAARVNYDTRVSWTVPARLFDLLDARQYVEIKNEGSVNAGLQPQFFLDSLNGKLINTDWYDEVYRTGFSQNHTLSLSGGTDQTDYYLSIGYTDQAGMIRKNDFTRKSARLSLEQKAGKRIVIGATIGYGENFNSAPNTGSLPWESFNFAGLGRLPLVSAPIVAPRNADGTYNINTSNRLGAGKNLTGIGFYNPVPIIELNNFTSAANQIQANIFGLLKITDGLSVRTQYGVDQLMVENLSFYSPVHGDGYDLGYAFNYLSKDWRRTWQNTLDYQVDLGKIHHFTFTLGNEQQYTSTEGWNAYRFGVANPVFTSFQGNFTAIDTDPFGNYQGENYLLSYFGRFNYQFNKKFLFTFNLRQDEYSAFAPGKKKGVFWGISGGYTVSEEKFWEPFLGRLFNYFRIRGSYGEVGNNSVGDFASYSFYNSALYGDQPTFYFYQAGNTDLTWETSKKTDAGIAFGMLNDRIQGEITYFENLIDGMILNAPQSPSKGIPGNSIPVNIGSMRNRGWEFSFGGTILKSKNITWSSNFNWSFQQNKVLTLADGNSDIFGFTADFELTNITRVGESIGSLLVVPTQGVNQANGRRVFINSEGGQIQYQHVPPPGESRWTFLDGSPAESVSSATDGRVYGPTLPKWFGGWDHTLRFKNIDFNIQFQYAGGNYVYNGTKAGLRDQRFWNNQTDVLNRWQKPGDITNIPRVVFGDNISNGSAIPISENVEKADFLRVRNILLGFRFPDRLIQRMRISSIRIYAAVNNAFLWTAYTGTDPEVSTNGNSNLAPGVDRNSVPMSRIYSIGLNLGF